MSESEIGNPFSGETEDASWLTVRLLMQGKEVGSVIGKGGEVIKQIRYESGARVHISDGSNPERLLSIAGTTEAIAIAFTKICDQVKEHKITILMLISTSQCGAVIGNRGCKIKEIREATGASVRVAADPLPNSTERVVTMVGEKEEVIQCFLQICDILLETPPKGNSILYIPNSHRGGGIYHQWGGYVGGALHETSGFIGSETLAALASLSGLSSSSFNRLGNRRFVDEGFDGRGNNNHVDQGFTTYEMQLPNELIGCVIGKAGCKIAEIRNISGASITISHTHKDEANDCGEDSGVANESSSRLITIKGVGDRVSIAKSLINMAVDLQKSRRNMSGQDERRNSNRNSGGFDDHFRLSNHSISTQMELAQILSKPETLTTLAALQNLSGMGLDFPGNIGSSFRGHRGFRNRDGEDHFRNTRRSKYNPY